MTDNAKAGSLNALQACRPEETRIFLLRHGEVEGHGEPRYNGQQDVALTPLERILSLSQFYGCVNILDYGACGRVTVQLLNG